jgi:transcriptional regulator GlxA family with amidase domain
MVDEQRRIEVAMLVCPDYAPIDVIGFHAVMASMPGVNVHLVWKHLDEFLGYGGFPTRATTTFADCPADLDVLLVGATPTELLEDSETLAFLADRGARAGWVAGVCEGSLVLGAAGLLRGYRATTNFHFYDQLDWFGATTVETPNVVEDRNRITAGPATGCIEIALRLVQVFFGSEVARQTELNAEYAPRPLFGVGTPALAGPELTQRTLAESHGWTQAITAGARRAADRLEASAAV